MRLLPRPADCRGSGPALLAALAVLSLAAQSTPRPATLTIAFHAATEDAATGGQVKMAVRPGQTVHAVVWEEGCQLAGRENSTAVPADADQSWAFEADAVVDAAGQPAVRLRYRHSRPDGPDPEQERLLVPGKSAALTIDALSALRDCHYDRLRLTITATAR
jgi:hypothetical protein